MPKCKEVQPDLFFSLILIPLFINSSAISLLPFKVAFKFKNIN